MVSAPEFSRPIDRRKIDGRLQKLFASDAERAALAKRFGLVSIEKMEAELTVEAEGDIIHANGQLHATFVQSCAVSGDDLAVTVDEPLAFRFIPPVEASPDEEIELEAEELDEIEYDGEHFDLGEAVAQSLALAIDPYAVGPNADAVRKEAGLLDEGASGPFAALAAFKKTE